MPKKFLVIFGICIMWSLWIFEESMFRYQLVQKSFGEKPKKGISITRLLFPNGQRMYEDNNVFNCRRYNLVPFNKRRY
jgi:hypothetical protein